MFFAVHPFDGYNVHDASPMRGALRNETPTLETTMKVISNSNVLFLAMAIVLSLSTLANANDDWPQWRGPQRNDQSTETGLLKTWPADGPKQLWVNNDSGLGYAGFSVADGKLFTLWGLRAATNLPCALMPIRAKRFGEP